MDRDEGMIDAVEIMNEFTRYSPSKGEQPLPLPIPGHWFRKICALADRIAEAENARDNFRERCAELESRLDIGTGNMYDVVVLENERMREALQQIAAYKYRGGCGGYTLTNPDDINLDSAATIAQRALGQFGEATSQNDGE